DSGKLVSRAEATCTCVKAVSSGPQRTYRQRNNPMGYRVVDWAPDSAPARGLLRRIAVPLAPSLFLVPGVVLWVA
ncbi:hypothetical protein CCUS01_16240, partial [Colletotrichum cuscutae]